MFGNLNGIQIANCVVIVLTVQPLRVVQPDGVCEVGGSTPGLSHGDLGIFLGGGQQRNLYIS